MKTNTDNNYNKKDKSPHILNTSANLLGLCFIVLTSIRIQNLSSYTLIDDFTSISIVFFMISCVLSFIAIRNEKELPKLEFIADIIFLLGLFFLFCITLLITFNIIK